MGLDSVSPECIACAFTGLAYIASGVWLKIPHEFEAAVIGGVHLAMALWLYVAA